MVKVKKGYSCDSCGRIFSSRAALGGHLHRGVCKSDGVDTVVRKFDKVSFPVKSRPSIYDISERARERGEFLRDRLVESRRLQKLRATSTEIKPVPSPEPMPVSESVPGSVDESDEKTELEKVLDLFDSHDSVHDEALRILFKLERQRKKIESESNSI